MTGWRLLYQCTALRQPVVCNVCIVLYLCCHRGLAGLEGLGVVSASHDQTLKVWTFDGDCIATLSGHTALVYRCGLPVVELTSSFI